MLDGYEMVSIYYDDNENVFEHDDGRLIHDVSDLIPPDKLMDLKLNGGTYYADSDDPDVKFEIVFPIRDEYRVLTYDVDENIMYDEEDKVVFNIFSIITPNDFFMFKKSKEDMFVTGKNGCNVELVYPSEWEMNDYH